MGESGLGRLLRDGALVVVTPTVGTPTAMSRITLDGEVTTWLHEAHLERALVDAHMERVDACMRELALDLSGWREVLRLIEGALAGTGLLTFIGAAVAGQWEVALSSLALPLLSALLHLAARPVLRLVLRFVTRRWLRRVLSDAPRLLSGPARSEGRPTPRGSGGGRLR